MTRNNWIALAVLTSVATFGACSPKGGQDRVVGAAARGQTGKEHYERCHDGKQESYGQRHIAVGDAR